MTDHVAVLKNPSEQKLAEFFSAGQNTLPGAAVMRQSAFAGFASKGLPNKRVEEFKYTDIRSILSDVHAFATRPTLQEAQHSLETAHFLAKIEAVRLTLVNGFFVPELSDLQQLPHGVEVISLADALSDNSLAAQLGSLTKAAENPLFQLNTTFMADGLVIRIGKDVKLEHPLHLRFTAGEKAAATASRVLFLVEEGASVTVLESHESADNVAVQLNDVVEFIVADHAEVKHVRVNAEGDQAIALSTLSARLGSHVDFSSVNSVFGAKAARHQVYLALEGEKSNAQINGTALLNKSQHADATLVADHIAPGCNSRELFKTVLDGDATGVFQGRINVDAEAQKTDGKMMSACLQLSDTSAMFNKPELEIFADDVQCGHGATCGALDSELLFYLESRGLPRAEAESLLIQAFVGEVFEMIDHEDVREELINHTADWLQKRR